MTNLEGAEPVTTLAQTFPLAEPNAGVDDEGVACAPCETSPPCRLAVPRLGAGMTVEQGFIEIVSHLTEVMVFWSEQVPQAPLADPGAGIEICEPVHQMRVALRRLRSAFRAFRDVMSCPALSTLKPELQVLGQTLGPARDWDVFISATLGDVIAALPNEPCLLQLRRVALRRRHEAYGTLNAFLAEGRFSRLAVSLACLRLQKPWETEADDLLREAQRSVLETFGTQMLRRRYRHILARGSTLLDGPTEQQSAMELHNFRLQCKQLRYLAEFFAPFFASKAAKRFIRRLARLQDALGTLNDASVAVELMTSLPKATRRAQGIVQGFIAGRTVDRGGELAQIWSRFRKQDEFW